MNVGPAVAKNYLRASSQSASPYGTFDQGGNVSEWNEAVVYGTDCCFRGGSFYGTASHDALLAPIRQSEDATSDAVPTVGFRVASVIPVPEPPTPVPGDYNGNGIVDAADYVVWRHRVGWVVPPFANGNGFVEWVDYEPWRANYGRTASSTGSGVGLNAGASIPEPMPERVLVVPLPAVEPGLSSKPTVTVALATLVRQAANTKNSTYLTASLSLITAHS